MVFETPTLPCADLTKKLKGEQDVAESHLLMLLLLLLLLLLSETVCCELPTQSCHRLHRCHVIQVPEEEQGHYVSMILVSVI